MTLPASRPSNTQIREAGLKSLQLALAAARFLAGDEVPHARLYDILDRLEVLPLLLAQPGKEERVAFRESIEGLIELDPIFTTAAAAARDMGG